MNLWRWTTLGIAVGVVLVAAIAWAGGPETQAQPAAQQPQADTAPTQEIEWLSGPDSKGRSA